MRREVGSMKCVRLSAAYQCPLCATPLRWAGAKVDCESGHEFECTHDGKVPVFSAAEEDASEYAIAAAAEVHDNALSWLFRTFKTSEDVLRWNLISRMHLKPGQRVLVTGAGAGNDLPWILKEIGETGQLFAQDISRQMLGSAINRVSSSSVPGPKNVEFSVGDAVNLPYVDSYFDAAYHFGGINLFSNIRKAIAEMDRVVCSGGRIVIGDEGLAPWLRETEYGQMILTNNPLAEYQPPLDCVPATARNVKLSWETGYYFYVIEFTKETEPLSLDPDVPHVGVRGGTMRKRFSGQLEGVCPELRRRLYEESQRMGISRVELLETLLVNGLQGFKEGSSS